MHREKPIGVHEVEYLGAEFVMKLVDLRERLKGLRLKRLDSLEEACQFRRGANAAFPELKLGLHEVI